MIGIYFYSLTYGTMEGGEEAILWSENHYTQEDWKRIVFEATAKAIREEQKKEYSYKDIILVGKVDYMPPNIPDEIWEFKTSEKKMVKSKPWQDHQVGLYCTMFERNYGIIYQPVQNEEGIYLKHLSMVERDDEWFEQELKKLYIFHQEVEKLWIASGKVL